MISGACHEFIRKCRTCPLIAQNRINWNEMSLVTVYWEKYWLLLFDWKPFFEIVSFELSWVVRVLRTTGPDVRPRAKVWRCPHSFSCSLACLLFLNLYRHLGLTLLYSSSSLYTQPSRFSIPTETQSCRIIMIEIKMPLALVACAGS